MGTYLLIQGGKAIGADDIGCVFRRESAPGCDWEHVRVAQLSDRLIEVECAVPALG